MSFPAVLAIGLPHGGEWIPILIIALLVFGKRLPEVSRGLGKAIMEFKKGLREGEEGIDPDAPQPAPRPPVQQVGSVEVRSLPPAAASQAPAAQAPAAAPPAQAPNPGSVAPPLG